MQDEHVDLVDEEGTIRATVLRSRRDDYPDLYVPLAVGVVLDSHRMAVVHFRPAQGRSAGCLDHVAGVIRSGENAPAAARREAREEIGANCMVVREMNPVAIADGMTYRHVFLMSLVGGFRPDREAGGVLTATHDALLTLRAAGTGFAPRFFIELDAATEFAGISVA